MMRSELIARLNSLRHEMEKNIPPYIRTSQAENQVLDLETVEACLYYFIDHEDADPHWD
jgi:hypothetical protein